MKNHIYTLMLQKKLYRVAVVILLACSSCSKYTELSPLTALSETTAFTTPANIELVMNGVYWSAAKGYYNGGSGRGYPFGAASIQMGEMRGEDMVNLQGFYTNTYTSIYTPTSSNVVNHWEQLYSLINQANVLIDGVRKAAADNIIEESVATSYEGEGRFLRALSYHELLVHFCKPFLEGNGTSAGVPYRTRSVSSSDAVQEELGIDRGTVITVYEKIVEDLDFAEQNLPATQPNGIARATKGAAIALKTRVKLHRGDWAGVIAEGEKLGTSASGTYVSEIGNYTLEEDPETPFVSYKSNRESIFSIANSATVNGGSNGALCHIFGPSSRGARDLVATSPNLYNAGFWVTGDLRRSKLQVGQTRGNYPFYFNYKYREYGVNGDWAPILRYAEVLLNVAEAYARAGEEEKSFALLNAVRNRSVPQQSQFTEVPADLVLAILQERRIEFAGEGKRWPDIHRLILDPNYAGAGIPAKLEVSQLSMSLYDETLRPVTAGRVEAIPYSDKRFLWPIPDSELSQNPTLRNQQNPGY